MSLPKLALLLAAAACAHAGVERFENRAGQPVAVAGDVIDLVGSDLAGAEVSIAGWPIPTALAGIQVLCDSYPAPIVSVAPGRIRIQLPWELAGLPATQVRIVRAGVKSDPTVVSLATVSPFIIGVSVPSIAPGQLVTLRVIGLGPRGRNPVDGTPPSSSSPGASLTRPLVMIGGVPAPVTADLLASGDPVDDAGVQSITVQLPYNADSGNVPALVRVGTVVSPPIQVPVAPAEIRMAISPALTQISMTMYQRFSIMLQGTSDQKVQWSVDRGAADVVPSITDGLFSVSGSIPSPNWLIVRATHASGAFATALAEVVSQNRKAYRIVPEFAIVPVGESVSFSMVDPDGATVPGAVWSYSDGGPDNPTNVYTAPVMYPQSQVRVAAYLPATDGNLNRVAVATITVVPRRVVPAGVTPAAAHIGEEVSFQGIGTPNLVIGAWFTTADGSRIRAAYSNQIVVPHGAVTGPAYVEMQLSAGGPVFLSAPYSLTVLSRLRLHAMRQRLSSNESVQIVAAAPDAPISAPLTWRADLGTVDAKGVFTAPSVSAPKFARIWACQTPTGDCGTVVVQILPIRLDPDPLILNPGETVQLKANRGGTEVSANWQALTSNVTVAASGRVTAGTGPFDGGSATVLASSGGVWQKLDISIRTAGSMAHATEYYDWLGSDNNSSNGRQALGIFAGPTVIKGTWIYTISRSLGLDRGPWYWTWLDVYRLDDRKNPVWVDSLEAPSQGAILNLVGDTLVVSGQEPDKSVFRYDISKGVPTLLSRGVLDSDPLSLPQGMSLVITSSADSTGPLAFEVRDPDTGQRRKLITDYSPFTHHSASGAAAGNWAVITLDYYFVSGASSEVVFFDTSGSSAVTRAVFPMPQYGYWPVILQDLAIVGGDVYRVDANGITLRAKLPGQQVLDSDAATKRILLSPAGLHQDAGCRVVDLSDVDHPKLSAATSHPSQMPVGKLGDDYFVLLDGGQNLAVYPILWQPGIHKVDSFPAMPWMNRMRVRDGYLYAAGPGWGYRGRLESLGIFEVDDVSAVPARVVATMDRPGDQVAWALELNGRYAYVGTDTELIVYDISSPATPVQVTVLPAPAISLTLQGKYLYAGSNTGATKTLLVYDVSDPARPKLTASLPLADFAYGLAAQPGSLAAALGRSGLAIYSLANPAKPALASQGNLVAWDVTGSQNLLYVAGGDDGLVIFEINSALALTTRSVASLAVNTDLRHATGYPAAQGVTLDPCGIVWIASAKEGRIYGLDVRNPDTPRYIADVVTGPGISGYASASTTVANNHLYVAGNDADFEVAAPQNVGLFGFTQPNPGEITPDRYGDQPWGAHASSAEPLKSIVLNGREREWSPGGSSRVGGRRFRQPKPLQPVR